VSYADKVLTCRDCGQSFVFTVGEQEFFASRGFTNDPSRCRDCRTARRGSSGGGGYGGGSYGGGGGSYGGGRRDREMFSVVCSSCGNDALVPFQPRGDKPVYCSDCFSKVRGSSTGGGYGGGGGGYGGGGYGGGRGY
jgi:CxxC-x17-CxxC domain-containing protein